MAENKYCPQCEEWVMTDETRHHCGYEWGISDAQIAKRLAENPPQPIKRESGAGPIIVALIGIAAALVFFLLIAPRGFEYFKCRDRCGESYSSCVQRASSMAKIFGSNSLAVANCNRSQASCEKGCLE